MNGGTSMVRSIPWWYAYVFSSRVSISHLISWFFISETETNYLSLYSASASQTSADRVFMVTGSKPRRSTSHITWSQSIRSTTHVYRVRAALSVSSSAKVLMRTWSTFTKFDTSNCSTTTCNAALANSFFNRCVDAGELAASVAIEAALAA